LGETYAHKPVKFYGWGGDKEGEISVGLGRGGEERAPSSGGAEQKGGHATPVFSGTGGERTKAFSQEQTNMRGTGDRRPTVH